jgi:L-seryl-tRNA(Ser) seleniumtransferase
MDPQSTQSTNTPPLGLTRRGLIAALSGLASACGTAASRLKEPHAWGHDSIYTRWLGLRPFLSCQGHNTVIGGSRMPPEVVRAIEEANDYFIDMHALNKAAGDYIAGVMGAEAALVSAGSFSAMLLGAAACLTGTDLEKIDALPHPTWDKVECLTQTQHRFNYDRAYRAAGMKIVEADTKQGLIDKISDKTAMISVLARVYRQKNNPPGTMMPEEFIEIGKQHGVPVLVDAASELPPPDIMTRYTEAGADLVVISGGKGLRGPQATGILAGRKDLIEAATLNHSPYKAVGRGMKVGKEEIMALVAAVRRYDALDHDAILEGWNKKAQYIADRLNEIPGMQAECKDNTQGYNNVSFSWDKNVIPVSGGELSKGLREGEPRILIGGGGDEPQAGLTTQCMRDGDEIFAARGIKAFLLGASKAT